MKQELWQRAEDLFHSALERSPEARRAFLEEACGDDTELRRQVELLVSQDAQAGSFLEKPLLADFTAALDARGSLVGRQYGPYGILSLLGAGGMGETYRAHDSKLGREVAIKILPPEFARDPERLAHFRREAHMLASLNHPNIAAIYGLEESAEADYLVLELVEGETLHGPLPLATALDRACQVAEALQATHEHGIIHRDLKPANIKVTPQGKVKVLDFGLAKAMWGTTGETNLPQAATVAGASSVAGHIVGTPGYMSPEQARGAPLDQRTDIWAFGCLLYELLTGRRAFEGETVEDTIAAVSDREPNWHALPAKTPAKVRRLLQRCLNKDTNHRLNNIADARTTIEEAQRGLAVERPVLRRRALALAGLLALIAASVTAVPIALKLGGLRDRLLATAKEWLLPTAPLTETERLTFDDGLTLSPAISSDGELLAYASERNGNVDIYVQHVSGGHPMRLTQHENWDWEPSFSPDGSHIAFRSERDGGGIYVVDTLGGGERKIAARGHLPRYSPDGSTIAYFVPPTYFGMAKMFLVAASGGLPRPFQPEFEQECGPPICSPLLWSSDGKYLLFDGVRATAPETHGWWVAPVSGGPAVCLERTPLLSEVWRQLEAWAGDEIYYSEGYSPTGHDLFRVPIRHDPWRVSGSPQKLTSGAGTKLGASISRDGRLVYYSGESISGLWSVGLNANRGISTGTPQRLSSDVALKLELTAAANGSRLAYLAFPTPDRAELRIRDAASGSEESIPGDVTTSKAAENEPRLSRDGTMIAYHATLGGKLVSYAHKIGAPPQAPLCEDCTVLDFFPDSAEVLILYGKRLMRQRLGDGRRVPLLEATFDIESAVLGPDGGRVAFLTRDAKGTAVLDVATIREHVTSERGSVRVAEDANFLASPAWSPDGQLLYFISERDGFRCVWAVRVERDGKPLAAPVAVLHSHVSPSLMGWAFPTIAVTPNRLYYLAGEYKGDIWSIRLGQR
jgi:eukaryotic-like serine/threonine-protein kinase